MTDVMSPVLSILFRPAPAPAPAPRATSSRPPPGKVRKVERDCGGDENLLPNCYGTGEIRPVRAGRLTDCVVSGTLERIQEIAEDGNLISNDLADYTLVECNICNLHLPMTRLRSHTKGVHKVPITEYKAMFGPDLTPLAVVWHRCGICQKLLMLDSDHVAVHLKSGGHPRITHKDYNEAFMVDTRTSKHTPRQPSSRDHSYSQNNFVTQLKSEETRGEEVGEPRWAQSVVSMTK